MSAVGLVHVLRAEIQHDHVVRREVIDVAVAASRLLADDLEHRLAVQRRTRDVGRFHREGDRHGRNRQHHASGRVELTETREEGVELRRIGLHVQIPDRLALWMSIALQKNIEIELDAPPVCELKVDLESITLLIDNLIDNAIKYSNNGSNIHVRLMDTPATMMLQVSDQGCGIPEDYREKVFERFFRLNPGDSYGTGLGLSIVKRAAQQHVATIELSHNMEAEKGLVVTINFQRNNR